MAKFININYFHMIMKAEDKVFKAYYQSKQLSLYFSQLKELTTLSNSSLQNVLNQLIKEGILELEKTKSNTFYRIKNKKIFSLKFAEISANRFASLKIGIKQPLKEFLNKIKDSVFTIVLFGSASSGKEEEGSDIDLVVAADRQLNLDKITKEVNSTSNYPLNIFKTSVKKFKENEDHIIKQARQTGFPIMGEQNFYEVELDEY